MEGREGRTGQELRELRSDFLGISGNLYCCVLGNRFVLYRFNNTC
jgi:hypothetical protein